VTPSSARTGPKLLLTFDRRRRSTGVFMIDVLPIVVSATGARLPARPLSP
jgi:hypothetical protein